MPASEQQQAWVRRVLGVALDGAPDGTPGATPGDAAGADGSVVRLAKGLLIWNQTRAHVAVQVRQLQDAIRRDAVDEPDYDEIVGNLGNLDAVLEVLDDRLTESLNALRGATDPGTKSRLATEARAVLAEYRSFAESEPLMQDIDANGFVPLDIRPRVMAALSAVATVI